MYGHDIIVIGASAGGIETLKDIVHDLPADLPAAVFIVVHLAPGSTSVLPAILSRYGPLPAVHPEDRQPIKHGLIYVAPPDLHLLVKPGHVRLGRGPRENRCRPAVDTLFRTAAAAYAGRVIGVVLSGGLDDGTAGLIAIKSRGGLAIVQDPDTALFPGMPSSAVRNASPDHVLPASAIAPLLAQLARTPAPPTPDTFPPTMEVESDIAELKMHAVINPNPPGEPAAFGCPECGGTLYELKEGNLIRYRCRVGHAYSPDTLLAEQSESIEAALWTALRALEESAALCRDVAARGQKSGRNELTQRFERRARETDAHAERVRTFLARRDAASKEVDTAPSAV